MSNSAILPGNLARLKLRTLMFGASLIGVAFFLRAALAQTPSERPFKFTSLGQLTIREQAIWKVDPTYPEDDIRMGVSGVAVAELDVDEKGSITDLEIVEAPSPSIEEAMAKAIRQWRFTPTILKRTGKPVGWHGKVTYYFVIENGRGAVYAPKDAPYVGRWPEKPE
jgi:TonB family protein